VYPCWHDAVCHKKGIHKIFTECDPMVLPIDNSV